jgi:hypothetical protein
MSSSLATSSFAAAMSASRVTPERSTTSTSARTMKVDTRGTAAV